jgi:hypothetical protein
LSKTQEREFEWYLRDHLFRSTNKGVLKFEEDSLPGTMIDSYLRYRDSKIDEISMILHPVVDYLVTRKVLKRNQNTLELAGNIVRKRCGKCYYVCYISENEPVVCFRCSGNNLQDFPKKNNSANIETRK